MSTRLVQWMFLTVWFTRLDCEVYQERPKIKTSDGHFVLEPAFDKNIYLLPNGPKSRVFVGDVDLLNINSTNTGGQYLPPPDTDLDRYMNGPNGILSRLDRLESQRVELPNSLLLNISLLWRRINRLNNRVSNLQTIINTRARDECQTHPCLNGGTCLNLVNDYHCLCPSNWEGKNCDVDVNECRNFAGTDLGCQNGATCINRPGTYECLCRSGWFGLHCTRKAKDCSGGDFEMCGYGTCVPVTTGEGIKCICSQGWTTNGTGVACLTDVNECDSSQGPRCSVNPKVDCVNLPGSFRCGPCPLGYEGDGYICSDIDECLTLPNGGCSTSPMVSCHNTIGSRICGPCPPGYLGDGVTCSWRGSCNIDRGGCHPSAQCIDNPALGGQIAQCVCPDGMDGDGIGLHGCYISSGSNSTVRRCENNPCGAHGQCHALRVGYTCICYTGYSGAHCDMSVNYCSNNPCHNGGSCRLDDSSTRGFRCECTAQYSGDLCQLISKTCGGVLDAEEGSIVYPLSNSTYNHNSRCAWVIHTAPNKVINVTFSKFDLEENPECLYDFLQIHDGRSSASQLIGRFCGNNYPKDGNIISSHNNLYFWFRSDQTVAKEGFALHWSSINPICGGEVDATTHGHISSPGSPGKYPPNRDCYWHISTTLGKRIQLHFFELDIEVHANCSYDYLAIYDGEHTSDPLLNMYCNSGQPAPVQSAGSDVLIHFHSDGYGSGNGFQIAYASVEGVPGCGGFFTEPKGEITSPTYDGKYLNNLLCEYKIKTSPGTKIHLDFKSFKLEKSMRCRYDYLKIYDGPSPDSPLVGKFCGITYPKSYTSSSNTLFIKFKSDYSMSSDGFKITYESICQQTIVGDSGIIKSPGYPFSYPENRVCEYIISTSPGKAIQLTFQDFDIEDNVYYNCEYDHVEIRDGPNINSTLMGKYCGGSDHTPPVLTSSLNYMYIRFNSDMSVSGTGFYANYTTIDTECGGIYKEITGIINHPAGDGSLYENSQSCTWMLVAPEGMHIKLTWNRFDLENMPSCYSDYLELTEIDENNENNLLGRFCGTTIPPALTTSTNRLMLKFESDSSIRSIGFSVSYSFLDEKSHCGGTYIKSHGFIYSPGWPKRYEPNRDCSWTITVPFGQQIKLNITQFDLERSIRNKCDLGDYLEIRNGGTETSPLIGKYCGSFTSKNIVSMTNVLYLRFHSDFYLSGNGFKIEWDGTIRGCGGTMTSSMGSITSPNYPQTYNENAECFYKIVTSQGSRIRISFAELDLERTSNCRDDYVEIYDGRDSNAPSLGRYCFMSPILNNLETTTNYVYIKFSSDVYIGAKGFLLNYNTVCRNNLTGSYGIIESPDYPNNYPNNLDCLWTINVPVGNRINVTFTNFDIQKTNYRPWLRSRPTCENDYLQTKESSDSTFSSKLCGSSIPPAISTNSNSLQIKFVTSSYIPLTGFRLEWVRYGCGGHILKQYGSLTLDKSLTSAGHMECEWFIESPLGTSITITFTDIYMTDDLNCTTDAIEIYNGQSVNSPLITKVCHRGTNTKVQSTTNLMLVRFIKHSSLKDVYFVSHFDGYKKGCGGTIESLSGYIYSINYPKNYDNNMDCIWSIVVPRNHRIELNFMELDLYSSYDYNEYKSECGDLIKIYDSDDLLAANYTYLICPNSQTSQIISKSNRLALQFITDNYGTAKGFKANFTVTCGAVIKALYSGTITNDKFTSHSNTSCTWTIYAPKPDQKITLTITHMSLPKNNNIVTNRNCPSTFLRILDGDDDIAPLVDEYCGRKVPPMIVSRGSALTIQLGTYTDKIEGQFSAHYSRLSSACGGTLTSEEGTLASPNYPQSYPVNANCEWILNTSPGNRVYITFEQFDLDYSEGCNQDYLELRENNGIGRLLGVFCGNDIPINTTTASKMYIKFHSDNTNSRRGFLLNYGFLHGNDITGLDHGEIASPLFPYPYVGSGEYSWRIVTDGIEPILITIDQLEIRVYGSICYNSLIIYDGYDEEAPVLEELCGILTSETKVIQASSSVVYLKLKLDDSNSGSLFHFRWSKISRNVQPPDPREKINCGSNETELIMPELSVNFQSPNYPNLYDDDLNCEWIFRTTSGHHLNLVFQEIKLEERPGCSFDYISIYSSNTGVQWTPVKEHICLSEYVSQETNSSTYMKVIFRTDSSMRYKGFRAEINSLCGGFISDTSGVISLSWFDWQNIYRVKRVCQWTVKVRPGRVIKMRFDHFNITNTDKDKECTTFVTLRNGDSIEAPLLSSGKYCGYSHENRNDIVTSSNALFISYATRGLYTFQNFRLHFEEQNIECGVTSKLDNLDHSWEIIMSPNYPSVPVPYSECIWTFTGPSGEILRVDFIDRFDLENKDDCSTEFVEVRDGSSGLSPLKGRYCSEKPGTIKTSGNMIYIKYSTQLLEPRNGFKANISIDICGGTILSSAGELSSPGYPHMQVIPYGSVCEWRIIGTPGRVFLLKPQEINLPESESTCGTKITIEESIPVNNSVTILKTYCNDVDDMTSVDTFSNELIIKFYIGKPSEWTKISDYRGFRFTFNSSIPTCGGVVSAPEGFLTTPGYPRETKILYCQWLITVPGKTRRVRLELMDFNPDKHRIGIFNDLNFESVINIITPGTNSTLMTHIFESSGNKLALYLWFSPLTTQHRFKAKFSSDEEALCGGPLSGSSGELISPVIDQSYVCEWHYNNKRDSDSDEYPMYNTIYITAKVNSSSHGFRCRFSDPKLSIRASVNNRGTSFIRDLCGNTEVALRIPAAVIDLKAVRSRSSSLYFSLQWKIQPCGGTIYASENSINVLNVPNNFNNSIDCAWILMVPMGNRIELKLEGSFQLGCAEEFVQISQGITQSTPTVWHYCKDEYQENPVTTTFTLMYIQYHSGAINNTNIRLMARTINFPCGGYLSKYDYVFASPNYPKNYFENQECTWIIRADLGNTIRLRFIERFVVEERPNCTKDVVIIYDWINDAYTEIARLCGRLPPPSFNSTFNRMKVVFRTDGDTNLDGFKAQWDPICGGNYIATEKEQNLYSPHYPDRYSSSLNCVYKISAPNKIIQLKFVDFELEGSYPDCEYDNLTLNAENNYNYIYSVYCGNEIPAPLHVYNEITLSFKTDRFQERRGFKLSYSYYACGGQVKEPTVLTSGYDDTYENNMNCSWTIEAPANKIVIFKFQYIDLEDNLGCYNDYIAVYNGAIIDADKRLALMCGFVNSTTVLRSSGNTALLQFVTDYNANYRGFKVEVYFSYSESVGCGGHIDLTTTSTTILKSPFINSSVVYENYLDCFWKISAPIDHVIKIEFTSFHMAPCQNVNQTALGYSKCDCDLVELKDGINPNSFVIGTYCGHQLPPQLSSSGNLMSVRLKTDGEIVSSGFEARLTVHQSVCGQSLYTVTSNVQRIKSPGYETGSIPRGLHCTYHLDPSSKPYTAVHLRINNLDLQPELKDTNECSKDKLIITSIPYTGNITLGKDYILNKQRDEFFTHAYYYDGTISFPDRFVLCGLKKSLDFYISSRASISLQTSAESDSLTHRGVEIEIVFAGFCGRNYTEPQGRIKSIYEYTDETETNDCYTLIAAPENYTISIYFMSVSPDYYSEDVNIEIFDGDKTSAPRLIKIAKEYDGDIPVFSTGRYLLLHSHKVNGDRVTFDLNYVTTNKGIGCGGKLNNELGKVTSPLYPAVYRQKATCEWELETPYGTRLLLHFSVFDLGRLCDQNYVQLVDKNGVTISTYCSETPADYTSKDNYVKIVFKTTLNNAGTGWVADFIGIL